MDQKILKLLAEQTELIGRILAKEGAPRSGNRGYRGFMTRKDQTISVGDVTDATQWHGVGGLFGEDCALERDIISTVVRPTGLLSRLPALPTQEEIMRVGAIIGFDPDATSEPNFPCENAPRGTYSTCRLQFELGRVKRDSNTIYIADAIRRANRGDTDFMLRNTLVSNSLGNLSGSYNAGGISGADVLNVMTLSEMQGIGVQFERELTRMLWIGDPAAAAPANTPNGGKVSFAGLDLLITTGITDAVSQSDCDNMDSLVHDFAFADVCDTTATPNIVQVISALERRIRMKAEMTGLAPVKWVIAMNPNLFEELTACWPCMYHTDRCGNNQANQNPTSINDDFAIQERDSYRTGMYLPVNGINYEVVVDFGIPELDNSDDPENIAVGSYASSIYFVPLTILSGWPVTYMRYLDYRGIGNDLSFLGGTEMMWSDDGRYLWASEQVNFCYEITAAINPGLVFRTPQLAWRIDDVLYTPLYPAQSPYPGDATYLSA